MPTAVKTTVTELPQSRVRVEAETDPDEVQRSPVNRAPKHGQQLKLPGLRQGKLALDDVQIDAVAANGHATIKSAQLDAGTNHVQLRGGIDLPQTTAGFGRTPGNFQINIDAPDLQQPTSFLSPPATGAEDSSPASSSARSWLST